MVFKERVDFNFVVRRISGILEGVEYQQRCGGGGGGHRGMCVCVCPVKLELEKAAEGHEYHLKGSEGSLLGAR